jgi:hypothetical protein
MCFTHLRTVLYKVKMKSGSPFPATAEASRFCRAAGEVREGMQAVFRGDESLPRA